jgi:hypothetical protein
VITPVRIGPLPFPMAIRPPIRAHSPIPKLNAMLGVAGGNIPVQMRTATPKTNINVITKVVPTPKRIPSILFLRKKIPPRIESVIDPMREGIFLC